MFSRIWHDPVWSKVIAGAILGLGALILSYVFDWWPWIFSTAYRAVAFISSESAIPHWALLVGGLLALFGLICVGILMWARFFETDARTSWKSYTSDIFFGLKWRWKYTTDGSIWEVVSFCPQCDYQVLPQRSSAYNVIIAIDYHCESCGRDLAEFTDSYEVLESRVVRSAQQKLRNGTWSSANVV